MTKRKSGRRPRDAAHDVEYARLFAARWAPTPDPGMPDEPPGLASPAWPTVRPQTYQERKRRDEEARLEVIGRAVTKWKPVTRGRTERVCVLCGQGPGFASHEPGEGHDPIYERQVVE